MHKGLLIPLLLIALVTLSPIALVGANTIAKAQTWPWGEKEEPFPWLDYLKSLTTERDVVLTIITRHESTIIVKTKELFLKSPVAKELGIKDIVAIYAGPELWVKYIEDAKKIGKPIDVAWGGGPTLFNMLDQKGLLEVLDPSKNPAYNAILYEASKIPDIIAGSPTKSIDAEGKVHWIGAAISSFGFTVNHQKLKEYEIPKPMKWSDLARPEYAKYLPGTPLVGIADPFMSTSNTRMYEIILQAYGWEKGWKILTLMAANAKIYDSSSGVRDGVIRGEIAVGITIDFYGYTAMHQNPNCEYIIPEGESIVNADPIAILEGTKHPVHAAAFVAWVLSEFGGQVVWLDTKINRLPINARVFETAEGKNRPDLKEAFETATKAGIIQFNETKALLWERAMQAYFKATLVNAHEDLQSVWAAVAQAYLEGKITKDQFDYLVNKLTELIKFKDPVTGREVVFTEDYAIKINPMLEKAAIFNQLMSIWEEKAREKYAKVYEELQRILAGGTIPTTSPSSTTSPSPSPSPSPTTSPTTTSPVTTSPMTTTSPTTTPTTPPTTTTPAPAAPPTRLYMIIGAIIILVIIILVYVTTKRRR